MAGDYPISAKIARREGVTGFQLIISESGEPTDCLITRSSGYAELDIQTCDSLLARAVFTPATGSEGQNMEDTYNSAVQWVLKK